MNSVYLRRDVIEERHVSLEKKEKKSASSAINREELVKRHDIHKYTKFGIKTRSFINLFYSCQIYCLRRSLSYFSIVDFLINIFQIT